MIGTEFGVRREWPVERYIRDAKLPDIGAGRTNEIGRELIGTAGGRNQTALFLPFLISRLHICV